MVKHHKIRHEKVIPNIKIFYLFNDKLVLEIEINRFKILPVHRQPDAEIFPLFTFPDIGLHQLHDGCAGIVAMLHRQDIKFMDEIRLGFFPADGDKSADAIVNHDPEKFLTFINLFKQGGCAVKFIQHIIDLFQRNKINIIFMPDLIGKLRYQRYFLILYFNKLNRQALLILNNAQLFCKLFWQGVLMYINIDGLIPEIRHGTIQVSSAIVLRAPAVLDLKIFFSVLVLHQSGRVHTVIIRCLVIVKSGLPCGIGNVFFIHRFFKRHTCAVGACIIKRLVILPDLGHQ